MPQFDDNEGPYDYLLGDNIFSRDCLAEKGQKDYEKSLGSARKEEQKYLDKSDPNLGYENRKKGGMTENDIKTELLGKLSEREGDENNGRPSPVFYEAIHELLGEMEKKIMNTTSIPGRGIDIGEENKIMQLRLDVGKKYDGWNQSKLSIDDIDPWVKSIKSAQDETLYMFKKLEAKNIGEDLISYYDLNSNGKHLCDSNDNGLITFRKGSEDYYIDSFSHVLFGWGLRDEKYLDKNGKDTGVISIQHFDRRNDRYRIDYSGAEKSVQSKVKEILGVNSNSCLSGIIYMDGNWSLRYKYKNSGSDSDDSIVDFLPIGEGVTIQEEGVYDGMKKNVKDSGDSKVSTESMIRENSAKVDYLYGSDLTNNHLSIISDSLQNRNSPLTSDMIKNACKKFPEVPCEYLLAFMQNDSGLGTNGKRAIANHNPGNVGNMDNGKNEYFNTWQEGVNACAENLQDRIIGYKTKISDIKKEFEDYLREIGEVFSESKFNSLFNPFPTSFQLATGTLVFEKDWDSFRRRILSSSSSLRNIPKFESKKIEDSAKEEYPLLKTLVHGSSSSQSSDKKTLSTPLGGFNRFFGKYMTDLAGPERVESIVGTWNNKLNG